MRITGARVYDPRLGFVRRDLCTQGEVFAPQSEDREVLNAEGLTAIPGLTDLHFHGCRGADFSDGDPQGLGTISAYQLSRGVTQICPASMTLPEETLLKICSTAAQCSREGLPGADLVGVNLEGPFLSGAKKGAQDGRWLREPDLPLFHRLEEAAQGLVKLVTVAPELPGALEFIREASRTARVSLGHTTAGYAAALAAFEAGASQATHLYNAMPPYSHREPGVVGAAADFANCRAELICDGVHIHPSVVRAVFRLFGPERVILISDSMRAAGMPDGSYTLGGQEVTVRGSRAALADGTLAGSVTDLMGCLAGAVSMGIPLEDAVRAAAVNPAEALGLYPRVGSLGDGSLANPVLLDRDLQIRTVLFHGRPVPPEKG